MTTSRRQDKLVMRANECSAPPWGFMMVPGRHSSGFYLPTRIAEDVRAQRAAAEAAADAEERARQEAEFHDLQRKRDEEKAARANAQAQVDKALDDVIECEGSNTIRDPLTEKLVYTTEETAKLAERIKRTSDSDVKAHLTRTYVNLVKRGGIRRIAAPSDVRVLDSLAKAHPNYMAPIELVRNELVASRGAGRPPEISPILLLGPAGIGKTHFASILAAALQAPIHRLNLDAPVSASALVGLDRQWSNSKSGLLFDAICRGEISNPIVLLDEIDKARPLSGDDPLAPLHTLLERSTAAAVRDISVEFVFDAAHVIWIATANYPLAIPPTIRSRFAEFVINDPTPAQAIAITEAVAASVITAKAPAGFTPIDRRLAVALAHLRPREISQAVAAAIAHAVTNGRSRLVRTDFSPDVFADDTEGPSVVWLN